VVCILNVYMRLNQSERGRWSVPELKLLGEGPGMTLLMSTFDGLIVGAETVS